MKVKVFRVRVWTFIRRKRITSISFMARLFGRKSNRCAALPPVVDHLQTSLVQEDDVNSDGEFEEAGPALSKRRTPSSLSFSMRSEEEKKGQSKRHMQVITMWNPASVTTIEAPVESSPKIWLRQASKRWKEHGSGRMLLDPIENGPETSQDWRARFVDIDPDRRWPVQGW